MGQIKEFVKKYKVPILIGIILGILVPLLFISSKKKSEESSQIENIQSPYFSESKEINIDLQNVSIDAPPKDKVFKVVESGDETLRNLLMDLYEYSKSIDIKENIYISFDDGAFSYSPENRILIIWSEKGLPLWFKLSEKEDVSMFCTFLIPHSFFFFFFLALKPSTLRTFKKSKNKTLIVKVNC